MITVLITTYVCPPRRNKSSQSLPRENNMPGSPSPVGYVGAGFIVCTVLIACSRHPYPYNLITIRTFLPLVLLSTRARQSATLAVIIGTCLGSLESRIACNVATIDLIIKHLLILGYEYRILECLVRTFRSKGAFSSGAKLSVSLLSRSRSKMAMDPESKGCNDVLGNP